MFAEPSPRSPLRQDSQARVLPVSYLTGGEANTSEYIQVVLESGILPKESVAAPCGAASGSMAGFQAAVASDQPSTIGLNVTNVKRLFGQRDLFAIDRILSSDWVAARHRLTSWRIRRREGREPASKSVSSGGERCGSDTGAVILARIRRGVHRLSYGGGTHPAGSSPAHSGSRPSYAAGHRA